MKKKWIKYSLWGFLLFLLVYTNIGIIRAPADDMKTTIQKKDILIYRKFFLYPNHKDIIIYKSNFFRENDSTENARYWFIQRVIGLPGDTILIDSNKVFINNQPEQIFESYQKNYIIQLTDSIEKFHHLNTLINEKVLISKKMEYAVSLPEKWYWNVRQDSNVVNIEEHLELPCVFENDIYPYHETIKWNKHFWGPFYLPKKADKIQLSKNNLLIYFPLIQQEEKLCELKNDSLFIKGKYTKEYVFKNDYYFVMGDNRDNAIDSRYLGPVKRKDIIGIVFSNLH